MVELVLDGVDTAASIRLNDHVVGQVNNQFRRFSFVVSSLLQPANNVLAITIQGSLSRASPPLFPLATPVIQALSPMLRLRRQAIHTLSRPAPSSTALITLTSCGSGLPTPDGIGGQLWVQLPTHLAQCQLHVPCLHCRHLSWTLHSTLTSPPCRSHWHLARVAASGHPARSPH